MKRTDILSTANKYVSHDRQTDHGNPEDTFGLIADLWNSYLFSGAENSVYITPDMAAMMLALLKVARQRQNPGHEDNYIDLAGYSACAGELAEAAGGRVDGDS